MTETDSTTEGKVFPLPGVNEGGFTSRDIAELRESVLGELQKAGFVLKIDELMFEGDKERIRQLNRSAVCDMRKRYGKRLKRKEMVLLDNIANGDEVVPEEIQPTLEYVDSSKENWGLFNYIKIHWSIPVSAGYGRRLCHIVRDRSNGKVIGIIGLCDPVFHIPTRDEAIGWGKDEKRCRMSKVMDAFVLGAVPPYNSILGGKLVASMLFTNEIRDAYRTKYAGKESYISGNIHSGDLVAITTLSALGKSAVYDRIRIPTGQRFISCGYSMGWGEFHFNGDIYRDLKKMVSVYKPASNKVEKWGTGFRNKREVISKALRLLDISINYMKHGIEREQFIIPLAKNFKEVLSFDERPLYYDVNIEEVAEFMKSRWVVPRSKRTPSFKEFQRDEYQLWG